MSAETDSTVLRIESTYRPFLPFAAWSSTRVPIAAWEERHREVLRLAANDSEVLKRAYEVAKRAAAVETGAIEGLYEIDRGITIAIATQAAVWESALKRTEKAASLIQSQLAAYDYVLDFATGVAPLVEAWIRRLHEVVCEAQTTYRVVVAAGTEEQRPLAHGTYKAEPNHVLQVDRSVHQYAGVSETPAEMARLLDELRTDAFLNAHAALQAAYSHHAFTAIHPFADGNGRVARALASVYTYRAARIPLLILSDSRKDYLAALSQADDGRPEAFVGLVFDAGLLALDLVQQNLRTAKLPSPVEAARSAMSLNRTKGGYSHTLVDQVANDLLAELARQFVSLCSEELKADQELTFDHNLISGNPGAEPPDGYRHPLAFEPRALQLIFRSPAPAEAKWVVHVRPYVPIDCDREDLLKLVCIEQDEEIGVRIREARPQITLALQMRMRMWLDVVVAKGLEALTERGSAELARRGYRPGAAKE